MKTNLLLILTDDQGPWAMGCAGNEEIRTPNLDSLAREGVRFESFFCASPVCSPARASLYTGRIPSQHGVHDWIRDHSLPPQAPDFLAGMTSLPDLLSAHGYNCGLSGKWHLGGHMTPQHGMHHWFCHPHGGGRYNDMEMIRGGQVVRCPGYLTDVITDDALGFLDAHAQRPFFLSVNYTAPHSPWEGHPPEIVASYDDCAFHSCPQETIHPWAISLTQRCHGDREMLKGYFAAVTAMDLNVGRILARLDALGLRENTLVAFLSDNGFSCGHHGFWGKGNGTFPLNMYENSVKVPALFSHRGLLPAGRVSRALVSQYDFVPTILEYLDLPRLDDPALPGAGFARVLRGETDEVREEVVVYDEYGPVRMIRTPEWKYVHRYPYGPHELYAIAQDPQERHNLIDDASRAATLQELRTRLAGWFERYVDPRRDGARFPVSGAGQLRRIEPAQPGEQAFHPGEQRT
jgi:choline-sulfatase